MSIAQKFVPNEVIARKVLAAVDAGLVSGLGTQELGKMCVEAVVNYAFGLPHGDQAPCVGRSVRAYKITLSDACWPNNAARTTGMRRLALITGSIRRSCKLSYRRYIPARLPGA